MMRRMVFERGHANADKAAVTEALKHIPGVVVKEEAGGSVAVEHDEGVDGVQVDRALQAHGKRMLARRVREAKPGTVELRDAVADALEAILGV